MPASLSDYRRILASSKDEPVAFWYLGMIFAQVAGVPEQPVLQAETIMVYRPRTIGADECCIDWWEIGYFRDPATGEVVDGWLNPLTGRTVEAPRSFEEGPGRYNVRQTETGLDIFLEQPHSRVLSVAATITRGAETTLLQQIEVKHRAFPLADGSLPPLSDDVASAAMTTLNIFTPNAALAADGPACAPGRGMYAFRLKSLAPWMGYGNSAGELYTRGIMAKGALDAPLNPIAWARLKEIFPRYFHCDTLAPPWG